MATIKGLTLEIGGEVTPLNKALASVNKTSRDLKGELRDVERLLKLDPTNTDLLNQRQKILGETVNTTKEKLEKLKEAERQAQEQFQKGEISEEQYRALQREVIKTEKDLEKFEEQLKKTNPKLEEFGAKAKETGDKLKDVGGKLTKGVTAPLAAAGAGLVAVGTKFDDVYDNIRIGTGATGEALQELNEDFRQIAKQTPASLDDVGVAVADYNTRLGISGEALQDLSQQTLELARITESDLSTTIEETSQSFQAFNLPAEEYGKSLDFIFKVSQSTGIGINRLQQNMVKFSPTLKTLGFDFEQSAVLMGQLDKAGVDVEQAMAGLTKAMGTLAKKGVTDANEAIKILFGQIKDAPSDMEGANAALEIFGAKAGPALAKSIREGKFEFQDLIKELQGSDETILGVADETKDFAERFIELKNNVMLALEPLGEQLFNAINGLIPLFQGLVGFIGNLVEKFANLSPATQKVIFVLLGIVAAMGPLLSLVGTMITLIGSMTTAAAGLGITLNAMLGWVGLIALAITALVAAMTLWISSSDDQVKQSEKLVEQAEQERQAYERLKQAQEEKTEASLSELAYTEKLWQELQTLTDENGNVTEANRARAQFIVGELNSALGSELELIDGKINGLQGEQAEIDNLIEKKRAQIYLESLEPAYREAISAALQKEKSLREQEIAIVEQQSKAKDEQARAAVLRHGFLITKEQDILENMQNAYLLDKENYKIYLEDKNDYESAAAAMMEGNYQALEDIVVGSTQRTYQTADSLVGKSKDDQIGILGEQYAGALTYLNDYAIKHKQGVEGYTADGLKEAQNYATSAKTEYEKVGGAVVDGTIEGMDKKKINVKKTIDALFNSIPEWARKILKIESPSKVMRDEVGKYITEGVAQGIIDHNGALKKAAEGMADEVKAQIKTLNDYIDTVNAEIKQLEKSKDASDTAGKKSIDKQIKAKKELIETTRDNIKTLQDEQKQFEETARTYKEAADEINRGLKDKAETIGLDKTQSSDTYKLWLAVYGKGATEAEKLQKKEESLTEQFNIQGKTVEATEAAYQLMVEHYGESYEGSRKLENQLLQERIAYEELYNSIIDVQKAKPEAGLKETTETNGLDKTRSSDTYKLWLAVHGKTATEAEKLQKQEESLTEQYNIQGETVEATEAAYQLMVEQYGENYEGSRKLYNQLQQERIAYEELYNSIIGVQKAKSELADNSAANLRAAQTSYGDFLAKNYKSLSNFGLSASDIFTTARKTSGLDKAESDVKSITVNQNITTTAATPSEIREAARDGATLATKEAYA